MTPKIAIIGRPNVGKSTLFNRLTKTKSAIVDYQPGITRDRQYGSVTFNDVSFTLIDTGGFLSDDEDLFKEDIHYQINLAIEEADIIIVLFNGREGVSPFDRDIIKILYDFHKPIFYAVNKIDDESHISSTYDFFQLGIKKIYPISSEHNRGIDDLLTDIVEKSGYDFDLEEKQDEEDIIKLGIIGRPNVGKSSFINKVLGKERVVVSDVAGTTRDSIDTNFTLNDKKYTLIDTAGIRKKGKTTDKVEKFSVMKALRALDRCDVALIFLDAKEGVTEQDITISGYAFDKGRAIIFVFNKWDITEEKSIRRCCDKLYYEAKYLNFTPAINISSLTGKNVLKVFEVVNRVYAKYSYRIETGKLNRIINEAILNVPPSMHKGKRLKFYYSTQIKSKPPTIVLFVNYPEAVHFSYKRYLINQIRKKADLSLTPINLIFRLRTGKIIFKSPKKVKHRKRK